MAISLPDQTGRTALVTGANTGIGLVTALELARAGARVHLACRSEEKANAAMEEIRAEVPEADLGFLKLDLGSLAAVRAAAETFLATGEPLHLLINNAGLVARDLSVDGFERTMAVNHIGHFLLTDLLKPRLLASAPARVVVVASRAHTRTDGIEYEKIHEPARSPTGFSEYSQSKLANVLFALGLAKRLEGTGVTTYAVHPGVIASDIWRDVPGPVRWVMKLFMNTTEDGARTQLYCATEPSIAEHSGRYYDESREKKASPLGRDVAAAQRLWQETEAWIAEAAGR